MSTRISAREAIEQLRNHPETYRTPESLRALAAQVDANSAGRITVLYSGPITDYVSSGQVVEAMVEAGEDVRVINTSEAADFLRSRDFNAAVARAFGVRDIQALSNGAYHGPAADWLYHPTEGPWADASARFVDATRGEVRTIISGADPSRVFGATELPHALSNPGITHIDGIPRRALMDLQARYGQQAPFEVITARSHAAVGTLRIDADDFSLPVKGPNRTLSLDSREFFSQTPGFEGRQPHFTQRSLQLAGSMPPTSVHVRAGMLHLDRAGSDLIQGPVAAETSTPSMLPGMGTAAKGLGALGAAATAYDAVDTWHDVSRLQGQGNATAAQAQIERFAIQNATGWAGAATFGAAAAIAGVESGPGLLVTGAIGGVIGAVAGDKVGDWLAERKINRQGDAQGNTWTFDPEHSARGWTRMERELDLQAMSASTRSMQIYREYTLTADAALSDRLTWQASATAIELALGAPPRNRDPYRLPASVVDPAQRSPFETGRAWVRDAQTDGWQQEITALVDGRVPTTRHIPASAVQAQALEHQAQAIIAHNATQTPTAMAEQFRAAWERNGWAQYGPLPEAVTDALQHPGRVMGSDGALYERDAQGRWVDDGLIWDSPANHKLRHELEATFQAQQQTQVPVTTLEPVIVRPGPEEAGKDEQAASCGQVLLPFSDPSHPRHALYADAQARFPDLSEARLNQVTAEMHKIGIAPGWKGQAVVLNGAVWVRRLDIPGQRFTIDLAQPEPSVQQTMEQATRYDLAEQQRIAQDQQQAMARGQSAGLVLGT